MIFPSYYPPQNAYNVNYPQQGTNIPYQSQNAVSGANTGIIWVQGEMGAKSYLVAPNNTVQLWDSESQTIYLKSADASGMPSMKILDYVIREPGSTEKEVEVTNYATKEEIESVRREIESFREKIFGLLKGVSEHE